VYLPNGQRSQNETRIDLSKHAEMIEAGYRVAWAMGVRSDQYAQEISEAFYTAWFGEPTDD
jgi:hypothetical protein